MLKKFFKKTNGWATILFILIPVKMIVRTLRFLFLSRENKRKVRETIGEIHLTKNKKLYTTKDVNGEEVMDDLGQHYTAVTAYNPINDKVAVNAITSIKTKNGIRKQDHINNKTILPIPPSEKGFDKHESAIDSKTYSYNKVKNRKLLKNDLGPIMNKKKFSPGFIKKMQDFVYKHPNKKRRKENRKKARWKKKK